MISYRLSETVDRIAACTGAHPAFARLIDAGPWQASHEGSTTILTRSDALHRTDWGPWKPGLNGLDFRVPDPLPAFALADWLPAKPRQGHPVRLSCGVAIPVVPAYLDGVEIQLDGSLAQPISAYGRLVTSLHDRTAVGPIGPNDPEVIDFCRLALASCCTRLTTEAIHAWHLLSSADVQSLFDAAITLPKTGADGSTSA